MVKPFLYVVCVCATSRLCPAASFSVSLSFSPAHSPSLSLSLSISLSLSSNVHRDVMRQYNLALVLAEEPAVSCASKHAMLPRRIASVQHHLCAPQPRMRRCSCNNINCSCNNNNRSCNNNCPCNNNNNNCSSLVHLRVWAQARVQSQDLENLMLGALGHPELPCSMSTSGVRFHRVDHVRDV